MVHALDVLIVGLAAWRVASLLVHEDGPWSVFDRIRGRAGVYREGELSGPAKLLSCVWCTSVWCVPPLWALHSAAPVAVAMLAAMAVAVVAETAVRR